MSGKKPGVGLVAGGMMTVAEACTHARVSRAELYKWMGSGRLKYVQMGSRGRRVPKNALDELLAKNLSG